MFLPATQERGLVVDVVHHARKPGPRAFSIERLFADIREGMPPDIRCRSHVAPFRSLGLGPRARNIIDARRHSGQVNHVIGDVHYLALGLPAANTIVTVHDCGMLLRLRGWRRTVMQVFWFSWPIARCRIVTAVSEATKRDLVEIAGAPPEKIRVIHNCVSSRFVPEPAAFNASQPRILLIGTSPNKNLGRMAAALAGLACAVELVGTPSGEQMAEFERHAVSLRALGDIGETELHDAYRRCDLVLFASIHEGFGLPILEAQAIGRPVVTGDCSSMPEVAGGGACLVDPLDPSSIREGVRRVADSAAYRSTLIAAGLENVRRFTVARTAESYAEVYREIAADSDRA